MALEWEGGRYRTISLVQEGLVLHMISIDSKELKFVFSTLVEIDDLSTTATPPRILLPGSMQ